MAMLIFTMIFMPLLIIAMVSTGIMIGKKRRLKIQQERELADAHRFLRKGYLRKGWKY
jgi:hypothetical protein